MWCGGGCTFDSGSAGDGLLVSAEDSGSLLAEEEGGAEGELVGAGEEPETGAGGHFEGGLVLIWRLGGRGELGVGSWELVCLCRYVVGRG